MKHFNLLFAGILTIYIITSVHTHPIIPYIPTRSQGLNTPRHLVGLIQQLYTNQSKSLYGTLTGNLFYNKSFHSSAISQCLFGIGDCETITISGSQAPNRNPKDWLADYFYLPTNFKSKISFKPSIDSLGSEFSFYISLDEWTPGFYFALYAPIVHSRWNLNMCETIDLKGTNSHAPGYFTPDALQRNDLFMNFTQYANGSILNPITQTVGSQETTTTFQNLLNARISSDQKGQTRVAEIRSIFGYNFIQNNRIHIALQALIAAPVGNRPEGEYLFEPMIGNGHHWELGASIFGNSIVYQTDDQSKEIIITSDINLSHLFGAQQKRTFDLKGKPFSRYLLIERLGSQITNNLKGNGIAPSAQFINEFLPVANLSKVWVDVSVTLQAEITAMVTFVCNNFSWDIGYNFWGQTCETIKLRAQNPFSNNQKWALKGDAHIFGFDRNADGNGPLVGAVALSATESVATIHSGTNYTQDRSIAQASLNPAIDMPQNATGDATGGSNNNPLSADSNNALLTIATSINPVFLTTFDLDVCEQKSRNISNALFTHFSYVWNNNALWQPYIGFGGEIEFNHNGNTSCITTQQCDRCLSCAISQWNIWFKGGMSF